MPIAPYPTFGAPVPGAGGVQPYEHSGPGGFVRVRGGTPAGPGGVVPYSRTYPGVGSVRVGAATRVGRAAARPAAATPASATPDLWPPTGTFLPSREGEVEEGMRGLQQLEDQGATSQSRWRSDYGIGMGEYDRQRGEQDTALQKALGLLKESFTKLGTRQEEGANKAGLLSGGALLQAAAKRGENEDKQATVRQEGHDKAVQGIDRARAKFVRDWAPPEGANPLGGRQWQDLATRLRNARENQSFYGLHQHEYAGQEAAEHGVMPLPAPSVALSRAQASAGRVYNRASGRMETPAQMHGYRRR